jgi:hypothetical protein
MKEVPLYLGEGPDKVLIGTATVDGPNVSCTITTPEIRQQLEGGLTYSFGFIPEGMTVDRVLLRDLSTEKLPKPIYKEAPNG